MSKHLDSLMQKEMSRQEFLATLGFGVASIFGFSGIIRLLTGKSIDKHLGHSSVGYGASSYGGGQEQPRA
jgi:hypothetical protein